MRREPGMVRAPHLYQAYDAARLALDCRRHGARLCPRNGRVCCTLFFAGNYAGITQTIPIAIYFEWMGGNTSVALFWVVVVIAFSFLVILFINMYTAHSQKYRERGLSRAERKQAKDLAGQGDSLDPAGGDALRIDREALVELMRDDAAPQGGR